jgi:hypothetical protein
VLNPALLEFLGEGGTSPAGLDRALTAAAARRR